jgi:hypothetical protein
VGAEIGRMGCCGMGSRHWMPDISHIASEERRPDQQRPASGEDYAPRPDLRDVPENPPVDELDLERGREKLERVLAK